jgi:hypothetical protein
VPQGEPISDNTDLVSFSVPTHGDRAPASPRASRTAAPPARTSAPAACRGWPGMASTPRPRALRKVAQLFRPQRERLAAPEGKSERGCRSRRCRKSASGAGPEEVGREAASGEAVSVNRSSACWQAAQPCTWLFSASPSGPLSLSVRSRWSCSAEGQESIRGGLRALRPAVQRQTQKSIVRRRFQRNNRPEAIGDRGRKKWQALSGFRASGRLISMSKSQPAATSAERYRSQAPSAKLPSKNLPPRPSALTTRRRFLSRCLRRGRGRVPRRLREPVPVQPRVPADVRRPAAPGGGRAQTRSSADNVVRLRRRVALPGSRLAATAGSSTEMQKANPATERLRAGKSIREFVRQRRWLQLPRLSLPTEVLRASVRHANGASFSANQLTDYSCARHA